MSIIKFLQGSKNTLPTLGFDNNTLYFVNNTRDTGYDSDGGSWPIFYHAPLVVPMSLLHRFNNSLEIRVRASNGSATARVAYIQT